MENKVQIFRSEIRRCTKYVSELQVNSQMVLPNPAFLFEGVPYFDYSKMLLNSVGDEFYEKAKELTESTGKLIINISIYADIYSYDINTLNKRLTANSRGSKAALKTYHVYKSCKYYTANELEKFFRFSFMQLHETTNVVDFCKKYDLSYTAVLEKYKICKPKSVGVLNRVRLYTEDELFRALNNFNVKQRSKIAADKSVHTSKVSLQSWCELRIRGTDLAPLTTICKLIAQNNDDDEEWFNHYHRVMLKIKEGSVTADAYSNDGIALYELGKITDVAKKESLEALRKFALSNGFTHAELNKLIIK